MPSVQPLRSLYSSYFDDSTSRGIGLELVKQLVASPTNIVIATCRSPATASDLDSLVGDAKGTLHILKLDTSSIEAIESIVQPVQAIVGDRGLDYLINNAAVVSCNSPL